MDPPISHSDFDIYIGAALALFREFDTDHSGSIDAKEVRKTASSAPSKTRERLLTLPC